jgi:hypothetical protein
VLESGAMGASGAINFDSSPFKQSHFLFCDNENLTLNKVFGIICAKQYALFPREN